MQRVASLGNSRIDEGYGLQMLAKRSGLDTDIQVFAVILCRRQRGAFDFVPRLFPPPISNWWNGNVVLSTDFCQANVGHAKSLGECPHGSRPDLFVEFGASQANSCFAQQSFLSAG